MTGRGAFVFIVVRAAAAARRLGIYEEEEDVRFRVMVLEAMLLLLFVDDRVCRIGEDR